MLATTGRTSRQRGSRTSAQPWTRCGRLVRDSSRSSSNRRASSAASANTTSSRITSTGCTPNRFTLTPLVPGPDPNTSSSAARASASAERQRARTGAAATTRNRSPTRSGAGRGRRTTPLTNVDGDERVAQRIAQRDHAHEARCRRASAGSGATRDRRRHRASGVRGARSRRAAKKAADRRAEPRDVLARRAHDDVRLQRGQVRGGRSRTAPGAGPACQPRPDLQ